MQLPAIPKRLTIRYLVEQDDGRLRAQIFHSATLGILAPLAEPAFQSFRILTDK
jgi:hypothetical protein